LEEKAVGAVDGDGNAIGQKKGGAHIQAAEAIIDRIEMVAQVWSPRAALGLGAQNCIDGEIAGEKDWRISRPLPQITEKLGINGR
jgi:hypothetical protein